MLRREDCYGLKIITSEEKRCLMGILRLQPRLALETHTRQVARGRLLSLHFVTGVKEVAVCIPHIWRKSQKGRGYNHLKCFALCDLEESGRVLPSKSYHSNSLYSMPGSQRGGVMS